MPIKGKRKTTKKRNCRLFTKNSPYWEPMLNQGEHSVSDYAISKNVMYLLRHSQKCIEQKMEHFISGEQKEHLQNPFPQSIHWSDGRWKACLAAGGGAKRRFQCCIDDSGTIVHFRALQGHSGRNLIDPSLQDNVVIPSKFFTKKHTTLDVRSIFILSSTLD